jgi:hypothetical protein
MNAARLRHLGSQLLCRSQPTRSSRCSLVLFVSLPILRIFYLRKLTLPAHLAQNSRPRSHRAPIRVGTKLHGAGHSSSGPSYGQTATNETVGGCRGPFGTRGSRGERSSDARRNASNKRPSPHQFRTRNDRNKTLQARANVSNLQEYQRQRSLSHRS